MSAPVFAARACAQCGVPLPAGSRRDRRFCSRRCYNRHSYLGRSREERRRYNNERVARWGAVSVSAEVYDKLCEAAERAGMSRSAYVEAALADIGGAP